MCFFVFLSGSAPENKQDFAVWLPQAATHFRYALKYPKFPLIPTKKENMFPPIDHIYIYICICIYKFKIYIDMYI